jgi:hypothetical protein
MIPVIYADNWMWNLSQPVGKGSMNTSKEDVFYIQWYYKMAAEHALTAPDRKAVYKNVVVNGVCTGQDSDPLVQSIKAHQKFLNHPVVDGRVSVATGTGKLQDKAFFVYRIGARIANMHPEQWPRLDKITGRPDPVAAAVKRTIPKI